jgi:hypothetical protein
MPFSLNDDEYNAVQAAAAPIHPLQRDAFLKALAVELERLDPRRCVVVRLKHAQEIERRTGFAVRKTGQDLEPLGARLPCGDGQRRFASGSGWPLRTSADRMPSTNARIFVFIH